jgi:regulator of replication initiation timing
MEEFMPGSPQLVPRPNPRTPRRQSRIKQQVAVHSLALEVQTLSLMLNNLRTRLSELEKKFNTDKITDADRGLLKNVDAMFGKPNPPHL